MSSTYGNNVAMNAVDEDPDTYALTDTEQNPQLTITLSNLFTIKRIYSIILEGKIYESKSIDHDLSIYLYIYMYLYISTSLNRSTYQSIINLYL